jgi:hypothetical protein
LSLSIAERFERSQEEGECKRLCCQKILAADLEISAAR